MKLNRKGFTLIEALAVIIILSMLMVITVPNVNKLINRQKDDALKNTEKSIINAAKIFFSDYKYEVTFNETCNNDNSNKLTIQKVQMESNEDISNSCLPIKILVDKKYLKINKEGSIKNPKTNKVLDLTDKNNCIKVEYNCQKKEFDIKDSNLTLNWKDE